MNTDNAASQCAIFSCYLLLLRPKYLTQHPNLKHPLSGWETTFQTRTKQREKISYVNLTMCIFVQQTGKHKILDRMIAGIAGEKAVCAGGYWGRGVKEQELWNCYCVWKILKGKQDTSVGTATILRDGRPRNRSLIARTSHRQGRPWGRSSVVSTEYRWSFPVVKTNGS